LNDKHPISLFIFLGGILLCCTTPKPIPTEAKAGAALVPVPTSTPTSMPMLSKSLPVMVGKQIIDPYTGKKLKEFAEAPNYEFAFPAEIEGQYWVGNVLIDANTQSILRTQQQEFQIDNNETVLRVDKSGKTLWSSKPGERVGSLRSPEIVADNTLVFVAVSSGIAVLDKASGKLLRTLKGPPDHLALFNSNIVGVDCTSPGARPERWMVAYQSSDGKESFRVALPTDEEPETPVVVGSNLLVRGDKYSLLVNAKGEEIFRLKERISQIKELQADKWFVTSDKRIFAIERGAKISWELKGFRENFVHETKVIVLPGGELLLYNFGAISDSGVELVRLDKDGKERWRSSCKPAGVDHSEYYHQAYITLRGDDMIVVSQGSYANFIEIVDAKSGVSKQRFQPI
jgi:outer membrane protein assembly factor BamB